MITPRLEIDLEKIQHNAKTLLARLATLGISVTAVTKVTLGNPEIASALLQAGVTALGDSRIKNIETMRQANIQASMTLLRSPMLTETDQVVAHANISLNTEFDVIKKLSHSAQKQGRSHGIILMVELGDLREGIMPRDVESIVEKILSLPAIELKGIGTNLGCRNGVSPDEKNMAELSALADSIEARFGINLEIVSGGNSANLDWAFSGKEMGRINNLRLGEAIILGLEPLHRQPIEGLYTDAMTLVAEVIESKVKPSLAWGQIAEATFGEEPQGVEQGDILQAILAIGRQDIDHSGLQSPAGLHILGASSDHLIVTSKTLPLLVGDEIKFGLNNSASSVP